ncbi:MAG: shikimate dehydrogenase [Alphaproteobacteria bacterium]|nr:shikimate dehydrogenase [Alphaproteobacteria bacterium]
MQDTLSRAVRVGLIGSGIQRSRSPALHVAEAAAHGVALTYELIDLATLGVGPEALPRLLAEAEAKGFAGLNVTHPCKQAVVHLLDALSDDARALGAVNTVQFHAGRRVGHNTDWWGFAESMRRGLPGAPLGHVLLLGAGGAGAAVAHAVLVLGARRLDVLDTACERAASLAAALRHRFPDRRIEAVDDPAPALAVADGLIHATPTGMAAHPGLPLPAALLSPRHWVAEVVYVPLETALLAAARRRGCRTLDGGGMAVFQAAEAFRLFTGVPADADRMLRHFAAMDR